MNLQQKLLSATCSAIAVLTMAGPSRALNETFTVVGTVKDHLKKPVSGALLRMTDEHNQVLSTATTDGEGQFKLTHGSCEVCKVLVTPPDKSRLASVMMDFPGNQSRTILFNLQRGFLVGGKVLGAGKGLKGITVHASDDSDKNTSIHGGGDTVTATDGTFKLTLTPGKKKLMLFNYRYPHFAAQSEHVFSVTEDCLLPDVTLSQI